MRTDTKDTQDQNEQNAPPPVAPPKADTDKMWTEMIAELELVGVKISTIKRSTNHE